MNVIKKIFLFSLLGGYFFMSSASAFLGEDLGLDLYKQIDEGFESLENIQYEYELAGQGETNINEVLKPIFADHGISCDISSSQDIDRMLSDGNVGMIVERCVGEGDPIPSALIEEVSNALNYIKDTFSRRAQNKSEKTYEIARIGLYSDGSIENSPFDLVTDMQEIDSIIFSRELEYNGVPYGNADQEFQDFVDKNWNDPIEETVEGAIDDLLGIDNESENTEDNPTTNESIVDNLEYHNYVCEPGNQLSGINEDQLGNIINSIEGTSGYTPNPSYWAYPGGVVSNGASWGGPFPGAGPEGSYTPVKDDWKCSDFFCIEVTFEKTNYGLVGGESMSIESVLKRAAKHLEKPANTSLTQRKQTTNNFELGTIVKNLSETLRGIRIEVSSQPVPILDVQSKKKKTVAVDSDKVEIENMLRKYYKNSSLDYDRKNDLHIFTSKTYEEKVVNTAGSMPIAYSENRITELQKFQEGLQENNRILSMSVDKSILQSDMKQFSLQFAELERFIIAIEEFCKTVVGISNEMKKIPSRGA